MRRLRTTYYTYAISLTTIWEDKSKKEVQLIHAIYLSKNIAVRFTEDISTPDDFIALKQAVEAAKRTVYTSQNLYFKSAELSDQLMPVQVDSALIEDERLNLELFQSQQLPAEEEPHFALEGEKFLCELSEKE